MTATSDTQNLIQSAQRPHAVLTCMEAYGVEPIEFIGQIGWYQVEEERQGEIKAGAHIGDLAILTEVENADIDPNQGKKAHPNFRGVYCSRETSIRCYYFAPLDRTHRA